MPQVGASARAGTMTKPKVQAKRAHTLLSIVKDAGTLAEVAKAAEAADAAEAERPGAAWASTAKAKAGAMVTTKAAAKAKSRPGQMEGNCATKAKTKARAMVTTNKATPKAKATAKAQRIREPQAKEEASH